MAPSHTVAPPAAVPFRVNWRIAAAVAGVILLALIINAWRSDDDPEDNASGAAPVASDGGASPPAAAAAEPAAAPAVPGVAGARDLTIPRISQVGSRGLVYTLMSARLEPGGSSDTLRLRVALENEGDGGDQLLGRFVPPGHRRRCDLPPNSGLEPRSWTATRRRKGPSPSACRPERTRGVIRITAMRLDRRDSTGLHRPRRQRAVRPPQVDAARAPSSRRLATEPRPLVTAPRICGHADRSDDTRRFRQCPACGSARAAGGRERLPGFLSGELILRLVVGDDDAGADHLSESSSIAGGATQRLTVDVRGAARDHAGRPAGARRGGEQPTCR